MTTDPPVDPPPPAAGTSPAGAAGDETTRFAPTERYPSAAGGEAPAQDSDGGAPGDRLPVGTGCAGPATAGRRDWPTPVLADSPARPLRPPATAAAPDRRRGR